MGARIAPRQHLGLSMLTVTLSNIGNPDFDEDPRQPLPDTDCYRVDVKDLAEASAVCLDYVHGYALGGSNWTGGEVTDKDGTPVAYVSYNGSVWPPGPYDPNHTCLYEASHELQTFATRGKKRKPIPFVSRYPRRATPNPLPQLDKNGQMLLRERLTHLAENGPSKPPKSNSPYDYAIYNGLTEYWVQLLGTGEYCFMSELDRVPLFSMQEGLEAITPAGREALNKLSFMRATTKKQVADVHRAKPLARRKRTRSLAS